MKAHDEVPQSRALDPGHEEILSTVCEYYAVDEDALYRTKRGATNEPRKVYEMGDRKNRDASVSLSPWIISPTIKT